MLFSMKMINMLTFSAAAAASHICKWLVVHAWACPVEHTQTICKHWQVVVFCEIKRADSGSDLCCVSGQYCLFYCLFSKLNNCPLVDITICYSSVISHISLNPSHVQINFKFCTPCTCAGRTLGLLRVLTLVYHSVKGMFPPSSTGHFSSVQHTREQ